MGKKIDGHIFELLDTTCLRVLQGLIAHHSSWSNGQGHQVKVKGQDHSFRRYHFSVRSGVSAARQRFSFLNDLYLWPWPFLHAARHRFLFLNDLHLWHWPFRHGKSSTRTSQVVRCPYNQLFSFFKCFVTTAIQPDIICEGFQLLSVAVSKGKR